MAWEADAGDKVCKETDRSADTAVEDKARSEYMESGREVLAEQKRKDSGAGTGLPDVHLFHDEAAKECVAPAGTKVNMEIDSDGRVTGVTYPDGKHKEFEYGKDGQLQKFSDGDGYSWHKEGNSWKLYDASGKPTKETLKAGTEVSVGKDGSFVVEYPDHSKEITRPDNAYIREDSEHHITRTVTATGDRKDFHYDSNGQLDQFTYPNGNYWKKEGDSWNLYDSTGKKTEEKLDPGSKCEVNSRGDFIMTDAAGTKTTSGVDGSVVIQMADGHVLRVSQPGGEIKNFEYDADGQLSRFTYGGENGGQSWRKEGNTWKLYGADGKDTGKTEPPGTRIEVDADGNFIVTYADGTREISHPNGSVSH